MSVSRLGLLTGCYALASFDSWHWTVDCLPPGLLCCSALSPRCVDLWPSVLYPRLRGNGVITIYCSSVLVLFPASDVVSVYHRIAFRLVVCCFLCYPVRHSLRCAGFVLLGLHSGVRPPSFVVAQLPFEHWLFSFGILGRPPSSFFLVRSMATLAILGLFFSAVLAMGFIENGCVLKLLCLQKTGFFTMTIIFVRRLQHFSAAGFSACGLVVRQVLAFVGVWLFCESFFPVRGLFVISVVPALLSLRLRCPGFWCHEMQ